MPLILVSQKYLVVFLASLTGLFLRISDSVQLTQEPWFPAFVLISAPLIDPLLRYEVLVGYSKFFRPTRHPWRRGTLPLPTFLVMWRPYMATLRVTSPRASHGVELLSLCLTEPFSRFQEETFFLWKLPFSRFSYFTGLSSSSFLYNYI